MNVFTIETDDGLTVSLGDLGARIIDIKLDGISVAAHYPNIDDYHQDLFYLGATIGPIANRLKDASLSIEGQHYQLKANENTNSLHGGADSYDTVVWCHGEQTNTSVNFHLSISEENNPLPGSIDLTTCYQVNGTQLQVDYTAKTSQLNYLNMTNHVYLNLNTGGQSIQNHEFSLFANSFLLCDEHGIPTGEAIDIDSPFPYSLNSPSAQPELDSATDHHFNATTEIASNHMNKLVTACSPESKISATISSNKAGFQFYTGQYLDSPFNAYDGFCVEPQFAPNAVNDNQLYSPFCSAENAYQHSIHYQFNWPDTSRD